MFGAYKFRRDWATCASDSKPYRMQHETWAYHAWSVPSPFDVSVRPKSERLTSVMPFQIPWFFISLTKALMALSICKRRRLNSMQRGTHSQRAAEGTYVAARLWYTTVPGVHKGVQHKVLQRATAVLWRMRPLQG